MTLETAKNLVETLLNKTWLVNGNKYTLSTLGWKFDGFDKGIRRLGWCRGGHYKQIGLSRKLTEFRTKEEVEQTIRHEIGHAIDNEIRGKSNHDYNWKNIARQCGYNGETTQKLSTEAQVISNKWVAICPQHGIIGGWSRKPKMALNRTHSCKRCHQKVEILLANDPKVLNLKKVA